MGGRWGAGPLLDIRESLSRLVLLGEAGWRVDRGGQGVTGALFVSSFQGDQAEMVLDDDDGASGTACCSRHGDSRFTRRPGRDRETSWSCGGLSLISLVEHPRLGESTTGGGRGPSECSSGSI